MRPLRIALLLIILVALLCAAASATGAQHPADVGGRKLRVVTVVDGITCAPTGRAYAYFFPSGRLKTCPLARDTIMFGQALPRQTWVEFTSEGSPRHAWLPRDVVLSGHLCKGEGYKKWSVLFHESGALALCFLPSETVIDGVPCQRGTFWNELRGGGKTGAFFHQNGRLQRCQASRSFALNGQPVKKWDVVQLDAYGRRVSS